MAMEYKNLVNGMPGMSESVYIHTCLLKVKGVGAWTSGFLDIVSLSGAALNSGVWEVHIVHSVLRTSWSCMLLCFKESLYIFCLLFWPGLQLI